MPEWATDNTALVEEPLDVKKEQGWIIEKPPLQWFNWLHQKTYQWISYFDRLINKNKNNADLKSQTVITGGGFWTFDLGTDTLSWSGTITVRMPGILYAEAQTIGADSTLIDDGEALYADFAAPVLFKGDTANTSDVITNVDYIDDLAVSMRIRGPGIPLSTTITAIDTDANTIEISNPATATASSVQLFSYPLVGLSINVEDFEDIVPAPNRIILARRFGSQCFVGNAEGPTLLEDGDSKELYLETPEVFSSDLIENLTVTNSVAANALTINLKTLAGNVPTVIDPIRLSFRNPTLATGDFIRENITTALSTTAVSGATLGHVSGVAEPIYVYAVRFSAGTIILAHSTALLDENKLHSGVISSGSATSRTGVYAPSAFTNCPVRLVARLTSTQTVAGTWTAVATTIALQPLGSILARNVVGDFSNTAVPAGRIGEIFGYATYTGSFRQIAASHSVMYDITSFPTVTPPAGNWIIHLNVPWAEISDNSVAANSSAAGIIALRSGASTVEDLQVFGYAGLVAAGYNFRGIGGATLQVPITTDGTKTYKASIGFIDRGGTPINNDLQVNGDANVGTPVTSGKIYAVRVG